MAKYLIKLSIPHSVENTLINDLNALSLVIYSAGGSVINLNVKSRARQIWVLIDAQDHVIQNLLDTKSFNVEIIKSIFLMEEDSDNKFVEELSFAGYFQSRNVGNNLAVQIYPH